MTWTVLLALVIGLGTALLVAQSRRAEIARMAAAVRERTDAERAGSAKARLQHPVVDLSQCLGCGACIDACPEDGVLELIHGQAQVVNGARCVGVANCARECPTGAITVTLGDTSERDDVPALDDDLQAIGQPGLFLAGEVTAQALIKTAIEHGTRVAAAVAARRPEGRSSIPDLVIVGAGPAGLACALEARRHRLRFLLVEQEDCIGGTVAKYPRRKLVLSQPVDLPLHGRLERTSYSKEELMALWQEVAERHRLPVRTGLSFRGLHRRRDGALVVEAGDERIAARNVCLAIGSRGSPRRLGVPGEELPKVAHSLVDAEAFAGRRVLVVGGGDSAVEAALALAGQADTEVTLSYRRDAFRRIRTRNADGLRAQVEAGRVRLLMCSEVACIGPEQVELTVAASDPAAAVAAERAGGVAVAAPPQRRVVLANDEVLVLIGGVPAIPLLQRAGVSFDASLRGGGGPALSEEGLRSLVRALTVGFACSLAAVAFVLWHGDYYLLDAARRPTHVKHGWLRPGLGVGLALGIASATLILLNLAYLWRRSQWLGLRFGSLRAWMTAHVATGVLALLCACLHAAMSPKNTPGGHAFWGLAVLLFTGAVGRYFYAWVPRAANGRELELAELRRQLLGRADEPPDGAAPAFWRHAHDQVDALVARRQWRPSFLGRLLSLLLGQRDLRRALAAIRQQGVEQGVPRTSVLATQRAVRRAHRAATTAAHFEDLRALLSTWRYLHRWVALAMVLLLVAHVVSALAFGAHFFDRGGAR